MSNIQLNAQELEIILDFLPPSYKPETPEKIKTLKSKIAKALAVAVVEEADNE